MPDNLRDVFAGRRRRPTAPSGERASTPSRGGIFGGTGGFTSSPAGTGGSRISLPSGCGGRFGCGATILAILLALIFLFMQYCGGSFDLGSLFPNETTPTETGVGGGSGQLATLAPAAPFATYYPPATAGTGTAGSWLVMLYEDADDSILEKDMCFDLNEAEKAGSSSLVTVVAQVDRYAGAYTGDGNWTDARRFLLTQDSNLDKINSQVVANLGEVNMSAGQTLVDFVTWAVKTYPAQKYALILSDHGMGWPGGWSDATPKGSVDQSIPLQASLGDELYLNEIDAALGQIRSQTGLNKFDLVGMDACLMAQLEVFTMLAPHARYAVASEEVEPALGWAYTSFIQALNQNPGMDGAGLGQAIVKGYIQDDQSITDSAAQGGGFLSPGSPFGGLFGDTTSNSQMAQELGQESSLTAVDLSKISQVNASFNHLVFLYQTAKQQNIASGRSYAQTFTNVFGDEVPASYLDLGNFVQIVKQKINTSEINQATDNVTSAIKQAIVAEKHGSKLPGASGIAIYFPNSELYGYRSTGAESYTATAGRFALDSLWDDFLAFHYSGRQFLESDARPVIPSSVKSPAAGGISVSQVTASNGTAAPGRPVTLSAAISGENLGFIYLFAGYYDSQSNSLLVVDQDYLESATSRQVNGVYYPDWGQGAFNLHFDWDPIVFAISDGKSRVTAVLKPHEYGRTYEEAVYTVDGLYTIAGTAQQLNARLFFVNGVLRQVYGFAGEADVSAPREIIPAAGDKFTVYETWLDLDSSGNVIKTSTEQGGTLTFGSEMFTWVSLDAAAGEYRVGFTVEDMDGNQQQSLVRVTVQ